MSPPTVLNDPGGAEGGRGRGDGGWGGAECKRSLAVMIYSDGVIETFSALSSMLSSQVHARAVWDLSMFTWTCF